MDNLYRQWLLKRQLVKWLDSKYFYRTRHAKDGMASMEGGSEEFNEETEISRIKKLAGI